MERRTIAGTTSCGCDGVVLIIRVFGCQGRAFRLLGWGGMVEQSKRMSYFCDLMAIGKQNVALR